jgi:hypothetical protein
MDLGALIREYPVDNKRRRTNGLIMLGAGILGFAVGIPLLIADLNRTYGPGQRPSPGPDFLVGAPLAIGLLGTVFGVIMLIRALQTRGSAIHVHERGILRRTGGTEQQIPWSDIASVRLQGVERKGLGNALGIDFRCAVQLSNGRRFAFTSHTTNAAELAATLDSAVNKG